MKIQNQVFRGADLIKNICNISVLNSVIDFKKVDVISVLNSVIDFVSKSSRDKKVAIKLNNKFESFNIAANDLLSEIFENIVRNFSINDLYLTFSSKELPPIFLITQILKTVKW